MDSNDGQAVVEVFAKAAAAGGVQQGRVGSGDNTGIKGHVLVAAQGADAAGGERPQQGLLHLGRGIAHFIQHESAAAGGQKCALAALFGFGEGSLGMPEERIHEQAFVQCAAVDGDEWPGVPGAQAVDGGGDKLFARARFAHHQHVGRDLGGLAHLFVEGPHGRGIAHQPVGGQILRMGQIQHGFAPPLGVVFRLLAAAELFGQAQPFQQGVYARAQAFQLHGQRGEPQGGGAVCGIAFLQAPGHAVQAAAHLAGQPPQAQAQKQKSSAEGGDVDAHDLHARAGGGEAGVQHGQATQHHGGGRHLRLKTDGHIADPLHAHLSVAPDGDAFTHGQLARTALLHVGHHAPVAEVVRAGAEGQVKARSAEVAGKARPHDVCIQTFFAQAGVLGLGLEEHPAFTVKKQAAHARFRFGGNGGFGGGVGRDGVAQFAQIQRKKQTAREFALAVVNRRGKAQHVECHGLHGAVHRHQRVDRLQRLPHSDVAGPLLTAHVVEGAGGAFQRGFWGHADDLALVVYEDIAVFRGNPHEGHLPVTQPLGPDTKAKTFGHGPQVHGAGGQDEQLIAGFGQGFFQRQAHGLGLELCVARNCAI